MYVLTHLNVKTVFLCPLLLQEPHPPVSSTGQLHHHRLVLRVATGSSAGGSRKIPGRSGARKHGGGEFDFQSENGSNG